MASGGAGGLIRRLFWGGVGCERGVPGLWGTGFAGVGRGCDVLR